MEYWCTGATKVAYIKGSPQRDSSRTSLGFTGFPQLSAGLTGNKLLLLLLAWLLRRQEAHSSSSTNESSFAWLWSSNVDSSSSDS